MSGHLDQIKKDRPAKVRAYEFIRRLIDGLLNKYLFLSVFIVSTIPCFFRHDRLFSGVFPETVNITVTFLAHIVISLIFSMIVTFIIRDCSSEKNERGFLVFLGFFISCVLNIPELPFFDSFALSLIFFILSLIRMDKFGLVIPVLVLFAVFISPMIVIPAVPYAVYFLIGSKKIFPEKAQQKNAAALTLSSLVSAVIALALHTLLNEDKLWFIRIVTPNFNAANDMINDVSKIGIFITVFSVCMFCSLAYPAGLKRTVVIGSICAAVVFVLNFKQNEIIFACLMLQGFVILFASRKSLYRFITDNSKAKKTAMIIIVAIILLEQLLSTIDYDAPLFGLVPFIITPFYVTYQELGLVQRGMFGSLYRLILGDHIPAEVFYPVFFSSFIILKIIFILLIVRTVRHSKCETEKNISFILIFALFCSPGIDKYYFETFNFILAWLCVILAYRNKHSMLLIPLLCALAMITHQIFASIIFPIVFIAIVYRAFIDSQGHTRRNMFVCFATLFVVGAGFLYLTFFIHPNAELNYGQICKIIDNNSGGFFEPHYDLIRYVYLDNGNEHVQKFHGKIDGRQIFNAFRVYILNIPALAVYIYAFVNSAVKCKSKVKKYAYIICCLSLLAILPAYIIETDYGRWCSQYISLILLAPLLLTKFQTEENKWYKDVGKKKFLIVSAVLIFSVLVQTNFTGLLMYYFPKFL